MSIHVASIVWRTELGGPSVKAVAMKLADCAADDGTKVYPSVRRVARESEVSERTVQTAIKALLSAGVLVMVERGGRGPEDPNVYRFDMNKLWELHAATLRRWKEEDDRLKGANSAPFASRRGPSSIKRSKDNANCDGSEQTETEGANSAPIDAKGANPATKGANSAVKGAAAAPNPSLPVIDPSLKTRGARVSDPDFGFRSDGAGQHRSLTIDQSTGVLYRPDAGVRAKARALARGWDFDGSEGLVAEFNEFNDGRRLTDVDAAFLGFCRTRGAHSSAAAHKPSGAPLPSDLAPAAGEVAIARLTASWDRWLRHVTQIDPRAADRMRRAFVVFALSAEPGPQSPLPRIPACAAKTKGTAA